MSGRINKSQIELNARADALEEEYAADIAAIRKRFRINATDVYVEIHQGGTQLVVRLSGTHEIRIGNTEWGDLVSRSDAEAEAEFTGGYWFDGDPIDVGAGGQNADLPQLAWAIFTAVRD